MGNKKRIIGAFLCALMLVSAACESSFVSSAKVTQESIKAKEAQISKSKKERDQLSSAKTNLEKVKKQLEESKSDLNNYITKLDGQLSDIQGKIDSLGDEITEKVHEIEVTTEELIEAEDIQKAQYEAMKKAAEDARAAQISSCCWSLAVFRTCSTRRSILRAFPCMTGKSSTSTLRQRIS